MEGKISISNYELRIEIHEMPAGNHFGSIKKDQKLKSRKKKNEKGSQTHGAFSCLLISRER